MTPAKRTTQNSELTERKAAASFVACPRCSYFLSSYRLLHDDFESAVGTSDTGWLTLTWDHNVRLLIQKSFGSNIYMNLDTFQGLCPECRRPYSYREGEPEKGKREFKVKIVP